MQSQHIIIKPIISEKSLKDASFGKYTFLVNSKANKTEIKKAIEEVFEVKVVKIMTNITKGSTTKNTKVGRKVRILADKKARFTLSKGQSILILYKHLGLDEKKEDKKEKSKKETVKKETAKKECDAKR